MRPRRKVRNLRVVHANRWRLTSLVSCQLRQFWRVHVQVYPITISVTTPCLNNLTEVQVRPNFFGSCNSHFARSFSGCTSDMPRNIHCVRHFAGNLRDLRRLRRSTSHFSGFRSLRDVTPRYYRSNSRTDIWNKEGSKRGYVVGSCPESSRRISAPHVPVRQLFKRPFPSVPSNIFPIIME